MEASLGLMSVVLELGLLMGLSMGLGKPITKRGNCERGEPQECNISRLYVETGVWNTEPPSLLPSNPAGASL